MKLTTKILLILLTSVFLGLFLSFYFKNETLAATCGNGVCELGENCSNCSIDCPNPTCGNGVCESSCGENFSNCCFDCGCPSGQICQNGQCVLSCSDECSYGEKQCVDADSYQVCGNFDSDSCYEWSDPISCPSGQTCQNGQCVTLPPPPPTCQDQCSFAGQIEKRCYGNYVQKRICGNYDSDSCLEWSSWQNEIFCGTSGWTNEYQCSLDGNYLQRKWIERGCSNEQCYLEEEWKNWQNCAAQGKVCQNNQCIGLPVSVDIKADGSDGPITIPYNSSATLTWTSNNASYCVASGAWLGFKSTSGSATINNLTSSKTYTLTCYGSGGFASDSVTVNVSSPSLSVSLSADPSSGCAPLNWVDLIASVSGSAEGNITYYFDCTSDGIWEKTHISSSPSHTAYDLCFFSNPGTYYAKVKVERGGIWAEDTIPIYVSSCGGGYYPSPTVDIKANGLDGTITIPYNTGAILTWSSTNANYCTASGAWSGSKPISGSESTGNLTSSKTYIITCYGPGGSASDLVVINVQQVLGTISPIIQKKVRNVSDGQKSFFESIIANPSEVLEFQITINSGSGANNVILKDVLPAKISIRQNTLKIDGVSFAGDITSGIYLGNLAANQTKVITFLADIANFDQFEFGSTTLTNSAILSFNGSSISDSATIVVQKAAVLGEATEAPTGFNFKIVSEILAIPFLTASLLTLLFKPHILQFEVCLNAKFREITSKKLLQLKIAQIKFKEKF